MQMKAMTMAQTKNRWGHKNHMLAGLCWNSIPKNCASLQLRQVVCLDLSLHYWKYYQSLHLLYTHTHTYRLQYRLATSVPRQPPPLSCTLVFVQIYREKLNEPLDNLHEGNLQAISAKCVCRRSKNVKPQRCYSHKINSDSMRSSPSILKHFSWRISPL